MTIHRMGVIDSFRSINDDKRPQKVDPGDENEGISPESDRVSTDP